MEEVQQLLNNIKQVLQQRYYFVVSDREKNWQFCVEYSLSSQVIGQILKGLTIFDFAKALDNCHEGYEHERLYLFAPKLRLVDSKGKAKRVQLYLKLYYNEEYKTIVIVSLHACQYPLKYAYSKSETEMV